MSGPDEDVCPVWLQQHSLEYPGVSTSTVWLLHFDREFEAASSNTGSTVTCLLFLSCGDSQ